MQRFSSQVLTQTAKAADSDRFEVVPIEAADAMSAARRIADIAARRRYQENGSVGYVSPGADADEGFFLAAIGVQYPCETGITLKGVTILIHVWPTD